MLSRGEITLAENSDLRNSYITPNRAFRIAWRSGTMFSRSIARLEVLDLSYWRTEFRVPLPLGIVIGNNELARLSKQSMRTIRSLNAYSHWCRS